MGSASAAKSHFNKIRNSEQSRPCYDTHTTIGPYLELMIELASFLSLTFFSFSFSKEVCLLFQPYLYSIFSQKKRYAGLEAGHLILNTQAERVIKSKQYSPL